MVLSENVKIICASLLLSYLPTSRGCDISTTIVNDWNIANNLNDWTLCYYQPYKDITRTSDLTACPTEEGYYIFVGAKAAQESPVIAVGAYGPSSVLTATTSSQYIAYKPSWTEFPSYNVYWYNYPQYSFGFAPTSAIYLNSDDITNSDTDNLRLSWSLSGVGGYRAGTTIRLRDSTVWFKVIYYCKIPTLHPTATPTTEQPSNAPTAAPTYVPTLFPTTAPSKSPTFSPYQMEIVPGSHICGDLENAKYIKYDTTFETCIDECAGGINDCVMVNYIPNLKSSTDSRCYVFDTQCEIYQDGDSGNLMAIRVVKNECIDYPTDWTDKYRDSCYHYGEYGWCSDGSINTRNVTVEDIIDETDLTYNLNANEVCCECGGGAQLLEMEVLIKYQSFVNNDLFGNTEFCEWKYGSEKWRVYDNIQLFDLCNKLRENVPKNYKFIQDPQLLNYSVDAIDCDVFIDKGYDQEIDVNICKNDGFDQELYFMSLFAITHDSMTIFVNDDWFNISSDLLSSNIKVQIMEYSQCLSILKSRISASSTLFCGIFPCDIDTPSPTSNPSQFPTTTTIISTNVQTPSPSISGSITLVSVSTAGNESSSAKSDTMFVVGMVLLVLGIFLIIGFMKFKMWESKRYKSKPDEVKTSRNKHLPQPSTSLQLPGQSAELRKDSISFLSENVL